MSINYSLYLNHLTNAKDYTAVIQNQTTKTMRELIHRMIGKGSTVTMAEALSVVEEYESVIQEALEEGFSIATPLFRISPSIQGVFISEQDTFDKSRHVLKLNVRSGSRISQIASRLKVEKVAAKSPQPHPVELTDVLSNTNNTHLSPGGVGIITGQRLKINAEDDQQGVFIMADDGTETRVSTYIHNMPSNLIFIIPDTLTAGDYHLDIRAIIKGRKMIKTGILDADLTVL